MAMSVLLALFLGAVLCPHVHSLPGSTAGPETVTQEDRDNRTLEGVHSLAQSNDNFAFSMYKVLAAQNPEKNVIFSPLSISAALAFLALGARGPTQTEILQGLKFNLTETPEANIHQGFQRLLRHLNRPETSLQLNMSAAMFLDQQLNLQERFRQEAREFYTADAISTDFQDLAAAMKHINDYVEQKTQGKIQKLFKHLEDDTQLVLVNCLYFTAKWESPFSPESTFTSNFHVNESREVTVPMMRATDIAVPYLRDEALGCTVVQLPYMDSSTSALLVLPDEGHMAAVEAALLPGTLQRWKDLLEKRMITLHLPKFSVSADYDLEQVLSEMGIRSIFSQQADLSGISQDEKLSISQVVHKAVLDVAEDGTKASAASGVVGGVRSIIVKRLIVMFNRPFLVALVSEDTRSILFLGKIVDPQQA